MSVLSHANPQRPGRREFTARHLLWLMIAFFSVVIAVNAVMAVMASRTWTGLIVKNSYVASQHYNERLEAARRQEELGWHSYIEATGSRVSIAIRDRKGEPLSRLRVSAKLTRTTTEAEDRTVPFQESAPGNYGAEAHLAPGLWLADVEAVDAAGRRYERQFRIVLRAGD